MKACAEGQQVDAAEHEADSNQAAQDPEQAEGFHREDQPAQSEGDKSIGESPAPAFDLAMRQRHKAGHAARSEEHTSELPVTL